MNQETDRHGKIAATGAWGRKENVPKPLGCQHISAGRRGTWRSRSRGGAPAGAIGERSLSLALALLTMAFAAALALPAAALAEDGGGKLATGGAPALGTSSGETYYYLDEDGKAQPVGGDYALISDDYSEWNRDATTIVVTAKSAIIRPPSYSVTCKDGAKLVLCDGANLTIKYGSVVVGGSGSLAVYAGGTSPTIGGTGTFKVIGPEEGHDGGPGVSGSLSVYGGNADVKGGDGEDAHGGAGAHGGDGVSGTLSVYGGNATVSGGKGGDGNDGDGGDGGSGGSGVSGTLSVYGGNATISGGEGGLSVTNHGGDGGPGVSGNPSVYGGSATIFGGEAGSGDLGSAGGPGVSGDLSVYGGSADVSGSKSYVGNHAGPGGDGVSGSLSVYGGSAAISGGEGRGRNSVGGSGVSESLYVRGGSADVGGGDGRRDIGKGCGGQVKYESPLTGFDRYFDYESWSDLASGTTSSKRYVKVVQKALTITADSGKKVYDGTALTKKSCTSEGLADGDSIASVTMTGSQTAVGSSANVPSAAKIMRGGDEVTARYAITYVNGTLEVTRRAVTITADSDSKAYDGKALTKGSCTASGLAKSDAHKFAVKMTKGSTITDLGTQPNTIATVDGVAVETGVQKAVGNYLVTTKNGTLSVTKRPVTVAVADASAAYDGETHAGKSKLAFSGLLKGHSASISYTPAKGTAVGTYKGSFGGGFKVSDAKGKDVTAYYNLAKKTPGMLTIAPAKKPRKPKISSVLFPSKSSANVSWTTATGAKSYELQWRVLGGKWHSAAVEGRSKSVKGFKKGKLYQFRVRGVIGTVKGTWSNVANHYYRTVTLKSAKRASAGAVKVTWKADPKANKGYRVVVYNKKGGKVLARKAVAAGKTSATVRGLASGKRVWVRVLPLRSSRGSTFEGVFSAGRYVRL